MKKFAAIILSALMVLSMVAIGVSSVSAVVKGTDGVLNVYKKSDTEPAEENGTVNPDDPATKKSLKDATFTIYKVFEHTDDGYVLQSDFRNALSGYVETLTKAKNTDNTYVTYGSTNALANEIGKVQVAAASITYTSEEQAKYVKTTADTTGLAAFTGLDYGVYLVVETNPPTGYTAVSQPFFVNIESGTAVDTYPKNEPFKMDKKIGTAASSSDTKSYSIGDTVPYIVTTKTPAYNTLTLDALYADKHGKDVEGGTTAPDPAQPDVKPDGVDDYNGYIPYTFTDTLSKGLTLKLPELTQTEITDIQNAVEADVSIPSENKETEIANRKHYAQLQKAFSVTVNDASFTYFKVTEQTTGNGESIYTINFDFDKIYKPNTAEAPADDSINLLDKNVVITYNAVLNENAKVVGDDASLNTTDNKNDITLKFKNDPSTNSDPVTYDNTNDDPEVFTYIMNLNKLLNGEQKTFLGSDTKPEFELYTDITNGLEKGVAVTTVEDGMYKVSDDEAAAAATLTVKDDGSLQVRGLSAGTYYLKETRAPIFGGVSYTPLTSYIQIIVEDTVVDGKITGVVKPTINNGNGASAITTTPTDGSFSFNVNNPKSQFELPTTGGYGILIFTLGGAVVLALAIIIFTIARKKKDTK